MRPYDPYDSLVPVFLRTEIPNQMVQVATAVFVEILGEPFLLTAAHVTDKSKLGELLVPTEEAFEPIHGYKAYIDLLPETERNDDTTDIAYYRLSTEFASLLARVFRIMRPDRRQLIRSAHEFAMYSASGYPASKAKKDGDQRSSEIFSFRGSVAGTDVYEKLNLSPDNSIVIHFQRKQAVDPNDFQPTPTPGLSGISGGAIFAWPRGQELLNDWSLPKMVGLVHTYRERDGLIIGTTMLPVLAAITLGRMKGFGGVR